MEEHPQRRIIVRNVVRIIPVPKDIRNIKAPPVIRTITLPYANED